MKTRSKFLVISLSLLLSACASVGQANRNAIWTTALSGITYAYQQAGRKCIADSSTRESAARCLAKVRDDYDPIFRAIEAASDIDNAVVVLCAKSKFNGIPLPKEVQALCQP